MIYRACAAVMATLVWLQAAAAMELPTPKGEVLLKITGSIAHTNTAEAAHFDRDMLTALPAQTFSTHTIWTDGLTTFKGVPLGTVLRTVGAKGSAIIATAVNDYMVEIPMADALAPGPVIAYDLNGAPMSVRNKGPLWIVYPYDSNDAFQSEIIFARSIWQLVAIEVRN